MRHITRRIAASFAATTACGALLAAPGVPAAATPSTPTSSLSASSCSTRWGSAAEVPRIPSMSSAPVSGVRAGRHACFDRVVVDVRGDVARRGVTVSYVDQVRQDGSGDVVRLRGRADLEMRIGNPVYDRRGRVVYDPADRDELVSTRGYRTLRQVALAGSFEGVTTIGVGVAHQRPFRVFVLDGATSDRIVLDIAHS